MKHVVVVLCLAFLVTGGAAQMKIGHITSETIMKSLPEAIDAQRTLDGLVAQWENELKKMQDDWKKKFDDYDRRKLILTDQSRAEAERELRSLDQAITDYRNRKFGQNGELFQKQQELMRPIQNKMFKVLEEVAKDEGYDYIFDRSGDILLLYATERHDLTETVLQRMKRFGK